MKLESLSTARKAQHSLTPNIPATGACLGSLFKCHSLTLTSVQSKICPLLCLLHFQSFLFMALIIYLCEYVLFLLGLSVLFCLLKFNYKTCSHTPSLGKFLPSSCCLLSSVEFISSFCDKTGVGHTWVRVGALSE